MTKRHLLAIALPIGLLAVGFAIGGQDGTLLSLLGAIALLVISFWGAIRIVGQQNAKPTSKTPPK